MSITRTSTDQSVNRKIHSTSSRKPFTLAEIHCDAVLLYHKNYITSSDNNVCVRFWNSCPNLSIPKLYCQWNQAFVSAEAIRQLPFDAADLHCFIVPFHFMLPQQTELLRNNNWAFISRKTRTLSEAPSCVSAQWSPSSHSPVRHLST